MKKFHLIFFLLLWMMVSGPVVAQTNYTPKTGDIITTAEGKYVVKGSNLITNPHFENGLNDWTAGDGTALSESNFSIESSGGPDGSAYLKALGGGGSSSAKSIKTGWGIEAGKTYLFSCWAMRTTAGMSNNTQYSRLFESDTQTATNSQLGTISYTADTWQQTQIVFTATKSFCVLNLSWLNSASSFDYFFLGEVEPSKELVTDKLTTLIAYTDSVYKVSASNEGTGINQFAPEVRVTFLSAINTAKGTLSSATSQTEINTAYATLNTAMNTFYASQNPPFIVGERYFIIHRGSGLFLTSAGSTGKSISVATNTNQNSQIFIFEKAPEGSSSTGFNIKDADGNYIYRNGSWDAFSGTTTLTENNAIFNTIKDGYYFQIKNMGSGSVLGTDAAKEGALVYSNKNGKGVANYDWAIEKYSVTIALDALIKKVEQTVSETTAGEDFGQVPQTALNAIKTALSKATAAAKTVTTFEEANHAIEELNTAVNTFNASFNNLEPFDTKKVYGISHSSGNLLTVTSTGNAIITAQATDEATASLQRMTLIAVPCDTLTLLYKIQSTDRDSLFLAMSDTYNTLWQTKSDTTAAIFQMTQIDGRYIGLKCMANGKFLGTDVANDGSAIYSDKAGEGNDYAHWTINVFAIKSDVDRSFLEKTIARGDTLASSMVQGYKAGQFNPTIINEFCKILTETKKGKETATTQNAIDSLNTLLTNAISTYKAKAHVTDESIADYIKDLLVVYYAEYNAAVEGSEKGQYTTTAKKVFFNAMETAKNTPATEQSLQALQTAHEQFLASVNDVDFSGLKSAIETANATLGKAVAGDCDGQYSQKDINVYQEAISSAQKVYDAKTASQQQVDSTASALKTAGTDFASAIVKIDFTELTKTITAANDTKNNALEEKGTGPGTYSESAFNELQVAVEKATAINGSKTVNQTYVNNSVDTLLKAINTFKSSRLPNDYSVLDSLVKVANQLYQNTPVGTDAGMVSKDMHDYLKESIDKNSSAMNSTLQTNIDKAVKLLKRDITLFRQNIVTGIQENMMEDIKIHPRKGELRIMNIPSNSNIFIFNANGNMIYQSVNEKETLVKLNKGSYIVRILTAKNGFTEHLLIK